MHTLVYYIRMPTIQSLPSTDPEVDAALYSHLRLNDIRENTERVIRHLHDPTRIPTAMDSQMVYRKDDYL